MKKTTILIFVLTLTSLSITQAQNRLAKLNLSGFKVNLICADENSISYKDTVEINIKDKDGTLSLTVIDQIGQVPKSEITVYIQSLEYLNIHNCQLVMSEELKTDSLVLVCNSSFGGLNINASHLDINIGAGSQFRIDGDVKVFDCAVGAGTQLNAAGLAADNVRAHIIGYSSLTVNTKNLVIEKKENASIKNVYTEND